MNWLPIETAPKDGSMILVCLPRQMNIVVRARYDRIHKHWLTDYEGEGGISRGAFFHQGDLWHPVPPPPTTTSKTSNLQEKCRIETVPAQGGLLSTMKEGKDFTMTLPPKQWVGLTDVEMHACWDSPLTPLGMKHARMIEAKLKQKNGYAEEKNT